MHRPLVLAIAVPCLAALAGPSDAGPAQRTLVDLSHAFDETTVYWPTEDGFVHERGVAGPTEGGWWYEAHRFRAAEHGGTHLDAPVHFAEHRQTVDAIPLERLAGPAVLVDVTAACGSDRDHEISRAELAAWEREHGAIPTGAIVLLRTGFGRFWPERARYLGTSERGPTAVAKLHFPGLGADAAGWLVRERSIAAVGLDTASIDRGASRNFETHRLLSAADVPVFENLAGLDRLPTRGFEVVALPMKIAGGSGAPLRAIAIVPALDR